MIGWKMWIQRKNIFFFRDQNGVEIDFIVEKSGEILLVEAKASERPDQKKLNFKKVVPLFKQKVTPVVACTVEETGMIHLKEFAVFNPSYGFAL